MNIVFWIIQGILALIFMLAGITKLTIERERLAKVATWTNRFSYKTVRFIGFIELLGAIGLILPGALYTVPVLTPVAAIGLAMVMILATYHHINHKEYRTIVYTLALLILIAFVAYGRFKML